MSSVAAGANSERTNRWLLIGAAALAILTGVLLFVALANFGSSDSKKIAPAVSSTGSEVLVAKQTIKAGQRITPEMVDSVKVSGPAVADAAKDKTLVIGKVSEGDIVQGQVISLSQITVPQAKACGLACILPTDKIGIALQGNEIALVAGFVQPGDRVNVVGSFKEKRGEKDVTRVETILQNVEVMAVAQKSVQAASGVDAKGTPVPQTGSAVGVTSSRASDVKPDPSAGNVTVALSREDGQLLVAARANGEITLTLQPLNIEPGPVPPPTYYDEFGPLTGLPRR